MKLFPEDDCPNCQHKLSGHEAFGCSDGWVWDNNGMSVDEGCKCNLGIVD